MKKQTRLLKYMPAEQRRYAHTAYAVEDLLFCLSGMKWVRCFESTPTGWGYLHIVIQRTNNTKSYVIPSQIGWQSAASGHQQRRQHHQPILYGL
jgi:hypothetical protein